MTIEGRRRILLLLSSSSYRAEDFLLAAERLQVDVTVGSDYRSTLADEVYGSTIELDFDDTAGSVQAIRRLAEDRPLSAVVAAEDTGTRLAAAVSVALDLPGNSPDSVETCRRKDRFRLALANSKTPSPWFRTYPLETEPQGVTQDLEFPCVVKPVELSASRGVVRADDPEELVGAFAEARRATEDAGRGGPILVEGYIPGDEVALEGILVGGELRTLAILDKPDPLVGPYFEETMFVTPSRLAPDVQGRIENLVAEVTALVGLREGPIHAELRINEQGVWPIEIAPRTIGGLCARLFRYRTGTALEELVLLHALGRPLPHQTEGPASGVMMIPIPRAGILTSIEGIDAAERVPEVREVSITAPLERHIDPLPRGNRYLGFIFALADSPETVEQALREAHSCLDIHIAVGPTKTARSPSLWRSLMTGTTDKSVDELSDRALDLAVVEEVMDLPVGESVVEEAFGILDEQVSRSVRRYSSNIAAARAVEKRLRKMGGQAWSLFLADSRLLAIEGRPGAEAATLICRAALNAVRASKQISDDAEARWEDEGGMIR